MVLFVNIEWLNLGIESAPLVRVLACEPYFILNVCRHEMSSLSLIRKIDLFSMNLEQCNKSGYPIRSVYACNYEVFSHILAFHVIFVAACPCSNI